MLPDLGEFPAGNLDEDGITASQRKLLMEALSIVFDGLNDEAVAQRLVRDDAPALPRSSVACVCMQVAAMLETMSLSRRCSAEALLQDGSLDLDAWSNVCAGVGRKPRPGSKSELIEELQCCRQEIFQLEKELSVQARFNDVSSLRELREADRSNQNLLSVNQSLEEKLKDRTEELRQTNESICELQQRISHQQKLIDQKSQRISMLEQEVEKTARMQKDILLREHKYGEKMLQLRMEEFMTASRDNQRQKRFLSLASITGSVIENDNATENGEDTMDNYGEENLDELAKKTLQDMQAEFDSFFQVRQEKMASFAQQCEDKIIKDQSRRLEAALEQAHIPDGPARERLCKALGISRRSCAVDAVAQTDCQWRQSERRVSGLDAFDDRPPSRNRSQRSTICSSHLDSSRRTSRNSVLQSRTDRERLELKRRSAGLRKAFRGNTKTSNDGFERRVRSHTSDGADSSASERGGQSDSENHQQTFQTVMPSETPEEEPLPVPERPQSPLSDELIRGNASPDTGSIAEEDLQNNAGQDHVEDDWQQFQSGDEDADVPSHDQETPELVEPIDSDTSFAHTTSALQDSGSSKPSSGKLPALASARSGSMQAQADKHRAGTPSTRASSRTESRASASRSNTPFWTSDAADLATAMPPKARKPAGSFGARGASSGRRQVLTFDRTA